jgi:hypothetical protein
MSDTSTIAGALTGATIVTYTRQAIENKLTIRPLIGMFVTGALLFAVSMWNSDVAEAFAVLIFVTAVVLNGAVVFDAIGKVTG